MCIRDRYYTQLHFCLLLQGLREEGLVQGQPGPPGQEAAGPDSLSAPARLVPEHHDEEVDREPDGGGN